MRISRQYEPWWKDGLETHTHAHTLRCRRLKLVRQRPSAGEAVGLGGILTARNKPCWRLSQRSVRPPGITSGKKKKNAQATLPPPRLIGASIPRSLSRPCFCPSAPPPFTPLLLYTCPTCRTASFVISNHSPCERLWQTGVLAASVWCWELGFPAE